MFFRLFEIKLFSIVTNYAKRFSMSFHVWNYSVKNYPIERESRFHISSEKMSLQKRRCNSSGSNCGAARGWSVFVGCVSDCVDSAVVLVLSFRVVTSGMGDIGKWRYTRATRDRGFANRKFWRSEILRAIWGAPVSVPVFIKSASTWEKDYLFFWNFEILPKLKKLQFLVFSQNSDS